MRVHVAAEALDHRVAGLCLDPFAFGLAALDCVDAPVPEPGNVREPLSHGGGL